MLLKICEHIKLVKEVSLQQLAREFQIAEEALTPMLEFCVSKGIIKEVATAPLCTKKCGGCYKTPNISYKLITN